MHDVWPSHQTYILPKLLRYLDSSGARCVLDAGCGSAVTLREMIRRGFDAYGVDLSAKRVESAQADLFGRVFQHDIQKAPIPPELQHVHFDTVVAIEVIEHLPDPRSFLRFCRSALGHRAGGGLIVSTPYHGYIKNVLMALANKMDDHYEPLQDGGHIKFWSPRTLSVIFREGGFEIHDIVGAGRFWPVWKSVVVYATLSRGTDLLP